MAQAFSKTGFDLSDKLFKSQPIKTARQALPRKPDDYWKHLQLNKVCPLDTFT